MQKNIKKNQRGVALIFVLTTLALVSLVVADFQYESRVEYQLSANARDELQAYNNAISAFRLRALLLRQATVLEGTIKTMLTSFGLPSNSIPPIAQIMQMIPVDCGLISGLMEIKEEEEVAAMPDGFFMGDCTAQLISEHSKMSLMALNNMRSKEAEMAGLRLIASFQGQQNEHHFEEDDENGQHAESPEELVAAIKDWIDVDTEETNSSADEDRHYQYLEDSYKAKNAPFDSTQELQLVLGVDDELFNILKDKVSVYTTDWKVDPSTASVEQILWTLMICMRPGLDPNMLGSHPGLPMFLESLQMVRMAGFSFQVMSSTVLIAMLEEAGLMEFFDAQAIKENFATKSGNTWFRILATGTAGNVQRTLNVVFQAAEGKTYYYREE